MAPSTPTWVQTHCTPTLLRYVLILELKLKFDKKNFRIKKKFFLSAWGLQRPSGDSRGREAGGEVG
jgi:hypothetical protein